jgi:hypothetical protein
MNSNLPVSADALVGAIAKAQTAIKADTGGMQYLKLSKGGFFIYGVDDTEVEEGSKWAVNPNSLMIGYVAWPAEGTGKPLGEEMRSILNDPIAESQLPNVGGNWTQQVGMQLMCVSGEDTGTEVVFKTSSKGGINGFNDFLNQVVANLKENVGSDRVVPLIKLEVNHYKHDKYGKIYTPNFCIVDWVPITSMPVVDEDAEDEDEPASVPTPTTDPQAKATPRRKRRRAAA